MTADTPDNDHVSQQRAAVQEGRRAEAEGRRVIYIHGRPYDDPGNDAGNELPRRIT